MFGFIFVLILLQLHCNISTSPRYHLFITMNHVWWLTDESYATAHAHTQIPEREREWFKCKKKIALFHHQPSTVNHRQLVNIQTTLTPNSLNSFAITQEFLNYTWVRMFRSTWFCTCVFTHVSIIANARTRTRTHTRAFMWIFYLLKVFVFETTPHSVLSNAPT